MFSALAGDVDAAFVVIQHLSPDHKSMMDDLLSRHTPLPIRTVSDGERLTAGRVYLIPPTHNLTVDGVTLKLVSKPERGLNLPIDRFFTDAAGVFGRRLVAVVLSGTGSDGARGARVVNEAGGLVIAQSAESAKFDGIPRSVIATGLVDEILAPEEIAERIRRFAEGTVPELRLRRPIEAADPDPYRAVIRMLSERSRIDFTAYKTGTVHRRIDRRVIARHVGDVAAYHKLLIAEPGEIDLLRRDVLIGVTSFLRDPDVFARLEADVLPKILAAPRSGEGVRVWVAGCATGEEAYTLAMLLDRTRERTGSRLPIKIFATDVEPAYLEIAQAGAYPESIVADLGEELVETYFDGEGGRFVAKDFLRRDIVFARHDLTSDPPFTRLDLVSCRNALIYLNADAQESVMRRIHYGLGPGGYLLLGSSESLGAISDDFETLDSKAKLYRCLRAVQLPVDLGRSPSTGTASVRRTRRARKAAGVEAARALLAERHVPPSVLVREDRSLVHVFGDAGEVLRVPSGGFNLDLSRMLPPRIASVAVSVMLRAFKSGSVASAEALAPDGASTYLVEGIPIVDGQDERTALISFIKQAPGPAAERSAVFDADLEAAHRIRDLEDELAHSREHLQSTIEELEASNEELQAANEELLASNEELQSTNEELQSVNEELYTVNAEHQEKIEILRQLNADLDAMARATGIPMLFLDDQLRVTRFTPALTGFIPLTSLDVGRPLDHFTVRLDAPWLVDALRQVLEEGRGFEREVQSTTAGPRPEVHRYLLRGLPYRAGERGEAAVVVTLLDISEVEHSRAWQSVLDGVASRVAVVDRACVITYVNEAWVAAARRGGDPHLRLSGVGAKVGGAMLGVSPADEQKVGAAVASAIGGGQREWSLECAGAGPAAGRVLWVRVSGLERDGAVVSVTECPGAGATG